VIDAIRVPTIVAVAMKDENWVQAMNEDMGALEKKQTWEIVDKPLYQKAIRCKRVYNVKYKFSCYRIY